MIQNINRAEILGHVGRIRVTEVSDNKKVAHMAVATNYAYKDRDGNAVIETTWHQVTAWQSEKCPVEDIWKGDTVHVKGRIHMLRYMDANGNDRTSMEIIADTLEVMPLDINGKEA